MADPRRARAFRFVRAHYADGVAELVYAFDEGPELVETLRFPDAPKVAPERRLAVDAALGLVHRIAGVSYYKAGVPPEIRVDGDPIDAPTAQLLDTIYEQGLGEFAYQNGLDLRGKVRFPHAATVSGAAIALALPRRTLVPLGGGKDSLVTVEMLRERGEPITCVYIGRSPLIEACAARTGLPTLAIGRELSPLLFEMNRAGALNGHVPVTAINSAILALAAVLYGFDTIAFSNERSASVATLEHDGREVNHQWSKGYAFERAFAQYLRSHVAGDLGYFSALRPWSELAVTQRFAKLTRYHDVFSSCNRNFRILGERPAARWCGSCPKCHFVFLALAPFVAKPHLVSVFGRNLLDDASQAAGFDALIEWQSHKPFECVGEARESRAAFGVLSSRPEWREDALVARFSREIAPRLPGGVPALAPLLAPAAEHALPERLHALLDADR